MKLVDAVIMGRFCGLETVSECIYNIDLHYWQVISYKEVEAEQKELAADIRAWETGALQLDWVYIEAEVSKQWKEYEESMERIERTNYPMPVQIH
jgi:hypothetical protein